MADWLAEPGPWAQFQAYLNQGQLKIQRSSDGEAVFYPRVMAPGSGNAELHWEDASGVAEIYSLSRIPQKPERGGDYYIAIVQLQEGPRLMSRLRLQGEQQPAIGDKVQAHIVQGDSDNALLVFNHGGQD